MPTDPPHTVSRADVWAALALLGVHPDGVTYETVIHPNHITVKRHRLDEQGQKYPAGGHVASETFEVSVTDD
ncbi:hypothetical protein [Georgenia faecalis]|uniref:hypothetical protein n=1 Tax=Georgenia faecalis TaxID=2483799 RepID=UPI000FD8B1A6|nr:hypothetical protein [Georgenia faecalis]